MAYIIKVEKILLWRIVNFQISVKYLFSALSSTGQLKKHKIEDLKVFTIKFDRNNTYSMEKVID